MKTKIIIFGFVFIFLMSWLTYSLGIDYVSGNDGIQVPALNENVDISFVVGILTTFWSLVTFQVINMPYFINIVFLIINMVLLFVVFQDIIVPIIQANHWVLIGLAIFATVAGLIIGLINKFDDIKNWFKFWTIINSIDIKTLIGGFINGW